MSNDGPYEVIKSAPGTWTAVGPGVDGTKWEQRSHWDAAGCAYLLNIAYSQGRESVKKESEARDAD